MAANRNLFQNYNHYGFINYYSNYNHNHYPIPTTVTSDPEPLDLSMKSTLIVTKIVKKAHNIEIVDLGTSSSSEDELLEEKCVPNSNFIEISDLPPLVSVPVRARAPVPSPVPVPVPEVELELEEPPNYLPLLASYVDSTNRSEPIKACSVSVIKANPKATLVQRSPSKAPPLPSSSLATPIKSESPEFESYTKKEWWPKMNLEKHRIKFRSPEESDKNHKAGGSAGPKMDFKSEKHTGMYECPVCRKICSTLSTLKNHMVTHDRMYTLRYKCDLCTNRYRKIRTLESHLESRHGRKYLCSGCQSSFQSEAEYNVHCQPLQIQIVIENGSNIARSQVSNQVECSVCFKQLPNQCQLNKHFRTHKDIVEEKEKEKQKIQNNDKSQETSSGSSKSTPVPVPKVVDLDPEFPCDFCETVFDRENFLTEHLKIQHMGQQWKCVVCAARFQWRDQVKRHLQVSHGMTSQELDGGHYVDFAKVVKQRRRVRGRGGGNEDVDEVNGGGNNAESIISFQNSKRRGKKLKKSNEGADGDGAGKKFKCELCQPNKFYKLFATLRCHYNKLHGNTVVSDHDLRSR